MKVVIFGIGKNFEDNYSFIQSNFEVVAIVDSDPKKQGNKVLGKTVENPENISNFDYEKILVTPSDYEEIYINLESKGVDKDKIVSLVMDTDVLYREIINGNTYYGQHADDLIIEAIFSRLGISKPAYIDLGCNHPIYYSNTYAFYKNGCRGINVDANGDLMGLVEKVKSEDINLNVGVASKAGTMTYYSFKHSNGRNTFCRDEIESWGGEPSEIIEIPVVTLKYIVEKYCPNGFPDLLDCDIEGLDYEVLESYDFNIDGPKVICVEVRESEISKFDGLLDNKGYYKFCRIGENNIYVKKQYSYCVSHLRMEQ